MPAVLTETGSPVPSSTYDRGFGETGHDFLTIDRRSDYIITSLLQRARR